MRKAGRSAIVGAHPARSIVAFGANLPSAVGSPRETLDRAVEMLAERGARVTAQSRWMATPAWPPGGGPDYTNGAGLVEFEGSALELLHVLQAVETALGRIRREGAENRWCARVCDIDLLCHGAMVAPGLHAWREAAEMPAEEALPELVLPHPRLHNRVFVLAPMADIAPDWRHPVLGKTVAEMLAALPDSERATIDAQNGGLEPVPGEGHMSPSE